MFRATEGSTEHSPLTLGVETTLWQVAAKKAGKCYRGVLEAAECFMVRWQRNEAKLSRKRHVSVMGGVQGNGEGEQSKGKPPWTKAGMIWQTGW